jgi:acetate kinase
MEDGATRGAVLTLNAGSSSVKFAVFDHMAAGAPDGRATLRGELENLGAAPHLRATDAAGRILIEQTWASGTAFPAVLAALLAFAESHLGGATLEAVGHRVVHGGAAYIAPTRVTPGVLTALTALTPLDPLHMPLNLAPIRAMAEARPDLAQVACFDTAFHHTLPLVAQAFALPRAVSDAGVRRYGFHGLSYEFIAGCLARQFPALAKGRVIVGHLGSGASLCALRGGASIATTTGFSALDGLVMATRCGSIDPGILLYLGRQGHSFDDIEDMLYRRSGLLGVSGISGDVRVLLASSDAHAAQAIELFNYRIACEAGGLAAALGGVDGLVFTAGIGEHAPAIRAEVCARLAWLGVELDAAANAAKGAVHGRISTASSKITVLVIATDEEAMIAQHTKSVVAQQVAA